MPQFKDFISPLINSEKYSITPLAGDASTRRYYRVVDNRKSWVLMEWEPFDQIADFPFFSVQKYFNEQGVRVPDIISYDKDIGLFLLEDLGDLTLERRFWEFQNQEVVMPFYEKSLDQLIKIHSLVFTNQDKRTCTAYHNEFNVEKLLWELNYAKKYLLKEFLQISMDTDTEKKLEQEFEDLCSDLYKSPQVICHRDFHSRNIMLMYDEVVIIDFQDARLGPPAYDLVSLFYDSYVKLSQGSMDHLMKYYVTNFKEFDQLGISEKDWNYYFDLQVIQRCFKACGSFASFKVTRDDNRYLKYIGPTLTTVSQQLQKTGRLPLLNDILNSNKGNWENL